MVLALSAAVPLGCIRARTSAPGSAGWHLVYPPEVADQRYPKGVHLARSAPLSEWTAGDAFPTEDGCDAARLQNIDDAIDRARVGHGDGAKFELPVRRAVNARCVRAQ